MSGILSPDAASKLNTLLNAATFGDTKILPYCSLKITNKNGDILYYNAVGEVNQQTADGVSSPRELSKNADEDIFVIYSCTKILQAVAMMQLVEKNLVSLDDPAIIERYLPELVTRKVLRGFEEGQTPRKPILDSIPADAAKITPRMLLLHMSGIEYSIWNKLVWEYISGDFSKTEGAKISNVLSLPLISEPGKEWHYGSNLEHLGLLVEHITGRNLQDYFTTEIYEPLGMKNTKFVQDVSPADKERVLPVYLRTGPHTFSEFPIAMGRNSSEDVFPKDYNAGSGLVSTIGDFSRLTTALLNNGTSPHTGASLLSPASVRLLTAPQPLPANQAFHIDSQTPLATTHDLQGRGNPHMSWSMAGAVQGPPLSPPPPPPPTLPPPSVSKDARRTKSPGSYYWGGLANTDWWVDGAAGISVELWTGLLPWADERWVEFAKQIEAAIYEGLAGT